jgi:photosystem II stability/assembly factor-like uncharacterized protein
MYVGTRAGGIFRSSDGGETWRRMYQTADGFPISQPVVAVRDPLFALAVLPEGELGFMLRTDDGFEHVRFDPDLRGAASLATDPMHPSRLYVGTEGNLSYSRDLGATWTDIEFRSHFFVDPATALAVDPLDGRHVYAAVDNTLFRSDTGGRSFNPLRIRCLVECLPAPSPAVPGLVYAAGKTTIFRSGDLGAHWSATGRTPGQVRDLEASPLDAETLFAATDAGLLRSTDAGATWGSLDVSTITSSASSIAIDPGDPAVLWAGVADGLYRSGDGGGTWERRSTGLVNSFVDELEVVPSTGRVLAGTAPAVPFVSDDLGRSWSPLTLPGTGRAFNFVVDPRNPFRVLTGGDELRVSNDGGLHWRILGPGPPGGAGVLALTPGPPAILLAGSGGQIYRSVEGSGRWTRVADHVFLLDHLVVDPTDPSVIYATVFNRLLRSEDSGKTWQRIGKALGQLLIGSVAPLGDGRLLASSFSGVFRSEDRGDTWHRLLGFNQEIVPGFSTGMPVVTADPSDPRTVFAATDGVVARSRDDGNHWYRIGSGLPSELMWSLAVDPSRGVAYVGTIQSGAFFLQLP